MGAIVLGQAVVQAAVTYSARVAGDVADLMTSPSVVWTDGRKPPAGGDALATVTLTATEAARVGVTNATAFGILKISESADITLIASTQLTLGELALGGTLDVKSLGMTVPRVTFARGATLAGGGLRVTENVTFDTQLNVSDMGVGSIVLRCPQPSAGYENVRIHVIGDTSRDYSLSYDADAKGLVIVAQPIPPAFDVSAPVLDYGVDMTNVVVKFTVSNWQSGSGYTGDTGATLTVRDATGRVVAQRGVLVTGDGEYAFDLVSLLEGRGAGYTYDISATTKKSRADDEEIVTGSGATEYVAYARDSWVNETAETFVKPKGDPAKTGEWTDTPAGTASVEDGYITYGATCSQLAFDANRATTQSIVRVDVRLLAEAGGRVPTAADLPTDAHAAIGIAQDGEGLYFAAVTPLATEATRLYGSGAYARPTVGRVYTVRAVFNYTAGTVAFSCDGNALTNAAGVAYLPISDVGLAAQKLKGLVFKGYGHLAQVAGVEQGTALARRGDEEYATLDEAIAAAGKTGGPIQLMWDALWHPTVEQFDIPYQFTGDHEVVVDAAASNTLARSGYEVLRLPDGSYAVQLITFNITFTPNGVAGDDYTQPFTATNMVFELVKNKFTADYGSAFSHWNPSADGSHPSNYADCAVFDMRPYGFTNLVLHAQWTVAMHTVTVATPDDYVYVERVMTNGPYALAAEHHGVRFYKTSAPGAATSAAFEVPHGARATIYFSTDIERAFANDYSSYLLAKVETDKDVQYSDLPKILSPLTAQTLTRVERWAYSRGVAPSALANSSFTTASYELDYAPLINETSVITIQDFQMVGGGCTFSVCIDGTRLRATDTIAGMLRVSKDLQTWDPVDVGDVSVDEDGVVTLTMDDAKFVKIVINRD